ncbi:hypothetical protein, partial [Pseudomonas savastanoi]|uniref:hypothetical protein n=1 Tax=Pseudomonas savastanoi TaxID=29438 RepID=UPI001C112EEE
VKRVRKTMSGRRTSRKTSLRRFPTEFSAVLAYTPLMMVVPSLFSSNSYFWFPLELSQQARSARI